MFEISLLAACESDFRQIFDVETNNSDESSSPWLRLLALSLVNTTNKMEREQKTLLLDNESLEETWNFLEFIFDGNLFDFKFAIWTNDANDCESFVVMMMILRLTINSLQREEEEKDIFSPLKFFFHSSIHSQVSRPFIKGDERKICANLFQLTSLQEFSFFSSEKWKKGTYLGKIQRWWSGVGDLWTEDAQIWDRKRLVAWFLINFPAESCGNHFSLFHHELFSIFSSIWPFFSLLNSSDESPNWSIRFNSWARRAAAP